MRNIEKMNNTNDGTRTLLESVMVPEVVKALSDWETYDNSNCVLIGGVALSYYVKPRTTTDVDVLYLSANDIPNSVEKFKKHRKGAFQHNQTHVEVETLSPESINLPTDIAQAIFDTSIKKGGIKIASPSGLVASKLYRFKLQDQADIEALLDYTEIDLSPFNLSEHELEKYRKLVEYLS